MTHAVLDILRSDPQLCGWLQRLEASAEPDLEITLPAGEDLPPMLLDLAVPHEDINPLVELAATARSADRELWWLIERCARVLVHSIGSIGEPRELPHLPTELGPAGRYFWVLVFVAVLPHVRGYHQARGIAADISRRTLADLGRHMALHRRRRGTGGLLVADWLAFHFRGELYQLGRLQFQRARLGQRTGQAIAAAGAPFGPGDSCLGLHIPDFYGSLTPSACERSLDDARSFFPRHFPAESYAIATCHSWLLDPQLRAYLPEDSNIIRFQRRFRPGYEVTEPSNTIPIGFVFGDPDLPFEALPRRTALERAIGDHLRGGRHWYSCNGWFLL
jgi:hypothetical protein